MTPPLAQAVPASVRALPALALPALLALVLALPGELFGQRATIPARSASSVNGGAVEVEESIAAPPRIEGRAFPGQSGVSRVAVPAPDTTQSSVTTSPVRVEDPGENAPRPPVAAMQTVPEPTQEIDPAKHERLGELRRELRIADSAAWARIALPADDLFDNEAVTTIDRLAEPVLKKIVEYIHLNDKKNLTVKTFYVKEQKNGKALAWARAMALIEWFTENSNLDEERFTAANPLPVVKASPKRNASFVGEVEFINRIELQLD